MADSDWMSLDDLLSSSGRPGPAQMMLVARWVTAALADGHRQGAVHGGLSPRTIGLELGTDGTPTRAVIRPPEVGGGLASAYAAPEVVTGAALDAAADVYSCGAVLWHCLTGQVPRPGSPPHVTAPEPLAGVLRAMLTEAPGQRPSAARAGELLTAPPPAEQLSATYDPTVELRPSPAPARDSRGRARGWVGALSAAVLLLGLSVLGWVVSQVVQDEPARTAAASSTRAAPETAAPGDGDGNGDGEEESLDEERVDDNDAAATTEVAAESTTEDKASTQPSAQEDEQDEEDSQPRQITLPPAAQLCEDGLAEPYPQVWAGNAVTSCPFSVNVREAYVEQGDSGADVEVVADSPVTGRTYTMACEDTSPVRCRGGNAAIVYFGDD